MMEPDDVRFLDTLLELTIRLVCTLCVRICVPVPAGSTFLVLFVVPELLHFWI